MVPQERLIETFRPIFVVGNSRSGTTLMGRVLGRHPRIFTFHELHFFEQLWSPGDQSKYLPLHEASNLGAYLLSIQRDGYLKIRVPIHYLEEAKFMLNQASDRRLTSADVFEVFLHYETGRQGKTISCDHTPRNVLYVGEILRLYPDARIINMVRDPRDVLLSQKGKWKRRLLGASNIPHREAFRARINYHPITMSKLWKASIRAVDAFSSDSRLLSIRFEDLLAHPEERVYEICHFLRLPFDKNMLDIPLEGSSRQPDQPKQIGINPKMSGNWQALDGLTPNEVFWCQWINKTTMARYSYPICPVSPRIPMLIISIVTLPLKLAAAFLVNLARMQNIASAVRKRLA